MLKSAAAGQLSANIPADFLDFLALSSGTDFNGLVLCGADQSPDAPGAGGFWQGLVTANLVWREDGQHSCYIILGETGMDLLTVDLNGENATSRDRISDDEVERFPSVQALIEHYLAIHLDA